MGACKCAYAEVIQLEKFVINGGKPLTGEVSISGAKNAAVAILPATILAADKCIIENLPDISDVAVSLQILSALARADILGGLPVEGGLLWCATELVSREELDRAADIVKEVLAQ